jgi:3-dehydroquinate dehydratase / shikimate dehydrogenase
MASRPRLCVTVNAASMADLLKRRDDAAALGELVDLRLDGVADLDVAGALADRRGPIVVSCRRREDGGAFDGPEETRLAWLVEACRRGAEFVEVEGWADVRQHPELSAGARLVRSFYGPSAPLPELVDRYRFLRGTGAGLVKLVVEAHELSDLLPLLALVAQLPPSDSRALVATGIAGVTSQLLAARLGSCWAYASLSSAPGQISVYRILSEFHLHRVGAATPVYGVVGRPIEHSVSPAMHNAAFEALGIDAVYVPLAASSAADFFRFAGAVGLTGASVTAPFKRAVLEDADVVEDDVWAKRLGVANTLKAVDGAWRARNTDPNGFLSPFDGNGAVLKGARAAVVGSGGAARAVAVALRDRGAVVTVHGRDAGRAAVAAAVAEGAVGTTVPVRAGEWDLLVNATPVGTWPGVGETPVPESVFSAGGMVCDLVYNPRETQLLRDAAGAGCQVLGGLDMLVSQAAAQFQWWTGREAPVDVMRRAAERRLEAMRTNDDKTGAQ